MPKNPTTMQMSLVLDNERVNGSIYLVRIEHDNWHTMEYDSGNQCYWMKGVRIDGNLPAYTLPDYPSFASWK